MTLAIVAGSVDSKGALPATLAYPGAMREEDCTNQPASLAADQWEGIVGFAALEKPVPMEYRLANFSAHEKKA